MSERTFIVGVDPGVHNLGVVVLSISNSQRARWRCDYHDTISVNKGNPESYQVALAVIEDLPWFDHSKVSTIGVEKFSPWGNRRGADRTMGSYIGACVWAHIQSGKHPIIVRPRDQKARADVLDKAGYEWYRDLDTDHERSAAAIALVAYERRTDEY